MEYKYTKHQVARGTLPDAQKEGNFYLVKNTAVLRATYQVRLLTFLASEAGKRLVLLVPRNFKPHSSLRSLIDEFPKTIQIEKIQ